MNMRGNSDTPRTNDHARMPTDCHPAWVVTVEFARELERENAKLRKSLARALTGLTAGFAEAQRNHIIAEGHRLLNSTKP